MTRGCSTSFVRRTRLEAPCGNMQASLASISTQPERLVLPGGECFRRKRRTAPIRLVLPVQRVTTALNGLSTALPTFSVDNLMNDVAPR